jgi:hypothetical protein
LGLRQLQGDVYPHPFVSFVNAAQGLEFYNLTGFTVQWADDSASTVCHIQLWTAGVGVSAGFHNHANQSFCEIHACIYNGTGAGGMAWATVPDGEFDPEQEDASKYTKITVPTMSEHGPLWRTSRDGVPIIRKNDTVDYPWHGAAFLTALVLFLIWTQPGLRATSFRTGPATPSRALTCGSRSSSRRSSRTPIPFPPRPARSPRACTRS